MEDIQLKEISRTQEEDKRCVVSHMGNLKQSDSQGKQNRNRQGAGNMENGS